MNFRLVNKRMIKNNRHSRIRGRKRCEKKVTLDLHWQQAKH